MGQKIGLMPVAFVLGLFAFALAGAVAHGAPSHRADATTATEPTSLSAAASGTPRTLPTTRPDSTLAFV